MGRAPRPHDAEYRNSWKVRRVSKGPRTFFRLSPSDKAQQGFAVRRGEATHVINPAILFSEQFGSLKALARCAYSLGTIGDIVDQIQDGLHGVRHYVPVGVPLLGVGNITPEGIDLINANYITAEEHERLKSSHVRKGDLLVTITGRLGTAALYQSEKSANLSAHVALCRMKAGHDPLYLKYFLASRFGEASLTKAQIGSTHPHINVRRLKELPLPVPPFDVQTKLVDEMELARESRKSKMRKADELLSGLDEWLLHNLGLKTLVAVVPSVFAIRLSQCKHGRVDVSNFQNAHIASPRSLMGKYPNAKLTDLALIIMGQAPPGEGYNDEKKGIPLLAGAADLGEVNPSPKKWTLSAPKQCKPNDIILCIRATIGNLNWADRTYALGRGVAGIRPNENVILSEFLFEALHMRRFYLAACGTGSTFKQVIAEQLNNCPIPLPPIEVQREISTELIHRREEARRLRAEAETEWASAKERFEAQLLGGHTKNITSKASRLSFPQAERVGNPSEKPPERFRTSRNDRAADKSGFDNDSLGTTAAIALNADKWQNKDKEASHDKGRNKKSPAKAGRVAKKPRGYKCDEEGVSGEDPGLGSKVHGIREGAGEYDATEGTPRNGEDSTRPVDSTRYYETAQGTKTYSEVAEIVAVSVTKTIEAVVELAPEVIRITPEWICKLHHNIAFELFPDWAGHFRAINVKVGTHTPPSFYEVPVHMRLYCEDLAPRLSSASEEKDLERSAEILAFADWRFQWIHPFKDFNGRVGRIILTALLYKLKLPPAETASTEINEREKYLKALRVADGGNLSLLTEIWVERLLKALGESG